MTIRVDSNGSGEGGADNRAGRGKVLTTLVVATKRTIVVTVGEATLNSLITRVTFGEIVLSGLGASMQTLSVMAIFNGLG